jgi:hypothetical protein
VLSADERPLHEASTIHLDVPLTDRTKQPACRATTISDPYVNEQIGAGRGAGTRMGLRLPRRGEIRHAAPRRLPLPADVPTSVLSD